MATEPHPDDEALDAGLDLLGDTLRERAASRPIPPFEPPPSVTPSVVTGPRRLRSVALVAVVSVAAAIVVSVLLWRAPVADRLQTGGPGPPSSPATAPGGNGTTMVTVPGPVPDGSSTGDGPATSVLPPSTAPIPTLQLRPDGLGAVPFGTSRGETLAAVRAAVGVPEPVSAVCPSYEAYRIGGLTVVFFSDRFLAWSIGSAGGAPPASGPMPTTERGVGVGSTMAEVRRVYPEVPIVPDQSQGGAYSIAAFAGVLDDTTEKKMWADFSGNGEGDVIVKMTGVAVHPDLPCGRGF